MLTKPEILLHSIVVLCGMVCVTVLAGMGKIDAGATVGLIGALGGVNGIITGVTTVKGGNGGA